MKIELLPSHLLFVIHSFLCRRPASIHHDGKLWEYANDVTYAQPARHPENPPQFKIEFLAVQTILTFL
jgi:hypothetical protein